MGPNQNLGATETRIGLSSSGDVLPQQTVQFVDGNVGEIYSFGSSPTAISHDDDNGAPLGEFLKRPTLIKTSTWTEAGFAESTFDPWTLFFNSGPIKNKIQNYAFFRGTLRVKVLVNSSPFYYGALQMYYTPLPANVYPIASVTNKYVTASQRPHIWIYPQTNTGGELSLPFLYPQDYLDLTNASTVSSMGALTLLQYTALASANGATSNGVTIQIYAWCDDAVLVGSTYKPALQSKDEYGNGPVSAPATALANWSQYLHKVPIIGRYARATTIGARATSDIAKLFGWTNVPVIDNVQPMKNLPFHDLASAHLAEPVSKFTLDPKAEQSVDPSIVGAPQVDELSVAYLVQKESYLTSSTWSTSDAATTLFFSALVKPWQIDPGTPATSGRYQVAFTPLAYTSAFFRSWRGDIIFRFKVICSKYHRGRLRISWDPIGSVNTAADTSNVLMTKIIDLAESDEVEFRVPYLQALPWLLNSTGPTTTNWSTSTMKTASGTDNGVISVRCLTNLSAPVDTAPVQIFVFVRGAENLELANPGEEVAFDRFSYFAVQSLNETVNLQALTEGSGDPDLRRYEVNFGEAIPSIRLLLRRSHLVDEQVFSPTIDTSKAASLQRLAMTRFPPAPGYDTNGGYTAKGVDDTATTFAYNYTHMNPLTWFGGAFVATRGATRWHINFDTSNIGQLSTVRIRRTPGKTINGPSTTWSNFTFDTGTSTSKYSQAFWSSPGNGAGVAGTVLHNLNTQTGISFECPQIVNYRFQFANPARWTTGTGADGSYLDTYTIDVPLKNPVYTNATSVVTQRYVSAGTDFGFYMFLNAPLLYYCATSGNTPV